MYVLLNRDNVVVDISFEICYTKLQSSNGLVVGCQKNEGTGVVSMATGLGYPLIQADGSNSENAVRVMQFDELPEDCKPNYWIYNSETNVLEPRYTTGAEKRENAYEVDTIINWQDAQITVDDANKLWQAYTAEGKVDIAKELTEKISEAKAKIREEYPDEETPEDESAEEVEE